MHSLQSNPSFPDVVNFRDFGGMPAQSGAKIRAGLLFRSGHFGGASDATRQTLDAMDFQIVADLRFQKEREEEPSAWPNSDRRGFYRVNGGAHSDGPHVAVLRAGDLSALSIDHFYQEFYRTIPFDPLYQPLFSSILLDMARSGGNTLVHCTVGKDRTGILAALIQRMLGASRDAVMEDYMKTRNASGLDRLVPEILARLTDRLKRNVSVEIAYKMLGVEESYLLAAFSEIERQAGSLDRYFDALGVTEDKRALLQAHYME